MEEINILIINKGEYYYKTINGNYSYQDIQNLLNTNEAISSTYRLLKTDLIPFRFRIYSKDYVPNPTFYSCLKSVEGKLVGDIPEQCVIILIDSEYDPSLDDYETLSINSIVEEYIEEHFIHYLPNKESDKAQPSLVWDEHIK